MPRISPILGALIALAGNTYAADLKPRIHSYSPEDGRLHFVGGIGYSWIRADEIVYVDGYRVSHLIWDYQSPVIFAEVGFRPAEDITVQARAKIGVLGKGRMDDYDWIEDYLKSYNFDDWTDHSFDGKVKLDHYFAGDIAVGYDLPISEVNTFNLHSGVKYTDIKFTSYGGSYIYSTYGFRDEIGTFGSDEKAISYQQMIPGLFGGASLTRQFGKGLISGRARAGATLRAKDVDNHWMRSLLFVGDLDSAPFVELGADVRFNVSGKLSVFAALDYEKHFEMKGDAYITETQTGLTELNPGGEGAAFRSLTLSLGLRGIF